MIEQHTGLYGKYIVTKAENEEPVTDCFVLRPSKDSAAVRALQAYAEATDNKQLSDDIFKWVGKPLQKPLTVEEVREKDIVYLEERHGRISQPCLIDQPIPQKDMYFISSMSEIFTHRVKAYNKFWRCWATKPTDEERQAAPWE